MCDAYIITTHLFPIRMGSGIMVPDCSPLNGAPHMTAPIADEQDIAIALLDEKVFAKRVAERLTELTGIPFPEKEDQTLTRSSIIWSCGMRAKKYSELKSRGYTFAGKDNRFKLSHESSPASWIVNGGGIGFIAVWGKSPRGVRLHLETNPGSPLGDHADVALLARHIMDIGISVSPIITSLAREGGERLYSWAELDIEPSHSLEECFEILVSSFRQGEPVMENLMRLVSEDQRVSPFRPSPYSWARDGRYPGHGLVPLSQMEPLFKIWLTQFKRLLQVAVSE